MKKTLVVIAALMLSAAAYAQSGAVNFANRLSGVFDAPILAPNGTDGAGTLGAVAQLYLVNGTSLTPVGTAISFRGASGALAKYFDGGALDIPGTSVGGNATLRVRSWVGASFAAATTKGESADFTITGLGGGTLPASNLDTLKGFSLATTVPEPTTIALGFLGAAALIAARRRK